MNGRFYPRVIKNWLTVTLVLHTCQLKEDKGKTKILTILGCSVAACVGRSRWCQVLETAMLYV